MRTVTIKGLLAHKLRLALTALAIVLGVTFISGTFVLTDTLHNTFTELFGNIYDKIDFQVRGVAQLGSGANAARNELPESLLATVRAVPGVAAAEGEVEGYAQFVAPDGKAIENGAEPTLGVNFDPDQQISSLRRPCSWAVGLARADLLATRVVPPGRRTPTCRSRIICSVIRSAGSGWGHPRPAPPCPVAIFLPGRFVVPGPYMYKPPLTG
jgi:hypothetical protein